MKLQLRLLVVMVIALLAMAGILYGQHQYALSGTNKVLASELNQRKIYFKSVLTTDQEQLNTFVRDYSFWDDMVDFTKTRDSRFANANIDSSLSTFNADAAWVYAVNGSLIYQVQAAPTNPLKTLVLPNSFISQLQKNKFAHFYVNDDGSLIEVRAATIVPGTDPSHAQPASGYFVAAQRINTAFLATLGKLSESRNSLLPATATVPKMTDGDDVTFTTPLPSWDGSNVAILKTTYDIPLISSLNTTYFQQLFQVGALGTVLIVVVTAVIWLWVLRPIRQVSLSITKRRPRLLDGLAHDHSEFGRLARLVQEFFVQKEQLAQSDAIKANLEQMNKEKTAFLSIAAHELKAPIGIVHLITEDLPISAPKMSADQLNGELATVALQSQKMATIIGDLQLASQGDSNTKLEYHPGIVDFDTFLASEIAANQLITDQKINFVGGTHKNIFVDPVRLSQVVGNLIRNASKYSPGTDKIDISSHARGETITLRIHDFGIGIPTADQKKVFDRFFRASNAAQHFQGLGIGLSICMQNVTEFGGTIAVQSEVDKGSTFTIELPVVV